jgi:long-chain fatty acid transport protein
MGTTLVSPRSTERFVYRPLTVRRALAGAALLTLASLVLAAPASATPEDLFGLGVRSTSLGMTGVSYSDDWEAAYTNPAGLARVRRRQIAGGLGGGTYQVTLNGQRVALEPPRGLTIGFALPLPFGDVLRDRLVLGAGFYTPANVLLRGQVPFAEVPQWTVLDRAQCLAITIGLGINLNDLVPGLRLGLGVNALASIIGDLTVRLDETSSFQSVVETQLLATFSPIAGVAIDQPEWGLGVVYRHEVRSEMNLHIVVRDLPVMLPVLTIGALVQYDPAQVALEGYYRPDPNVRIIANLTARLWSFYPGPYHPTTEGSFLPPAPGFHDTVSPRVGIEGTIRSGRAALTLRAGYALELSPSLGANFGAQRNADGSPRLDAMMNAVLAPLRVLDNDRHIVTAGFGIAWDLSSEARFRLDLYGQLHALVDRTHPLDLTSTMPPAMGMAAPAGMQTGGYLVMGGWMLGIEF